MNLFKFLAVTIFMTCFLLDNIEAYPQNPDLPLFVNVTLFELEDFTGPSHTFTVITEECTEIPEDVGHNVASVLTQNDDCVKLFTKIGCTGESVCVCEEINFPEGDTFRDNIGSIRVSELDSVTKSCVV
ncbi:hypothetical protein RCL_jg4011.t1 [Rhizophagus clarus]|uniref:Uncharacterized protein n=1 Tax=Rhizophagus clarus TaxID=94130 RepID=A0A8H3KRJ4_9GLOM|nr:hypothetical protein RCL_jg4011.t1 [Rhizophagus clarus]